MYINEIAGFGHLRYFAKEGKEMWQQAKDTYESYRTANQFLNFATL